MKKLMILVLCTYSLMAYKTGDILDKKVIDTLGMKQDTLYVIDFFASWCHSCKEELPLVSKVHRDKIVKVIGVNIDKDISDGKSFVSEMTLPFPIVYDNTHALVKIFNPVGVPALYYVKNAKILSIQIGAVPEVDKKITQEVKKL